MQVGKRIYLEREVTLFPQILLSTSKNNFEEQIRNVSLFSRLGNDFLC